MRWLWLVVLTACADESTRATVVHVQLTATCADCAIGSSYTDSCGPMIPLIETETDAVDVKSDADQLHGLAQIQYPDGSHDDFVLDEFLASADIYDVHARETMLYRIQPDGAITDVNLSLLAEATDNTLRFSYAALDYDSTRMFTITEEHTVDAPRPLAVDLEGPDMCCATGRPSGLGAIVLALVCARARRRRVKIT